MRTLLFPAMQLAVAAGIITLTDASSNGEVLESPNELTLARAFPEEKLLNILLPREEWHPFPTLKERERWEQLSKPVRSRLLALGEASLNKALPPLPATLYLGYAQRGNRSDFEAVFFERRVMLQNLVLAECLEGKDRFLNATADALWSICEESTWCLP